jgi:Tfp pilus assembly protein PilN
MNAVNLLPESTRGHRPSGKLAGSAYAVVGLLVAVLVMAVVYVVTSNDISDKQTKIAAAEAEAEEARARAGSFTAFSDFAEIKEARLASVQTLAAVRFDWERLMREVSHVIPSDIWLVDMTASTIPQDSSGGTAPTGSVDATGGTAALNPSLALSGCATGQASVANLMVRLRKLHRSEDVQLTESARQEDVGVGGAATTDSVASSSDGCPPGRYRFEVTVSFSAPAPGGETGSEAVPAALGGGS